MCVSVRFSGYLIREKGASAGDVMTVCTDVAVFCLTLEMASLVVIGSQLCTYVAVSFDVQELNVGTH